MVEILLLLKHHWLQEGYQSRPLTIDDGSRHGPLIDQVQCFTKGRPQEASGMPALYIP
jgi:hypothetical protein